MSSPNPARLPVSPQVRFMKNVYMKTLIPKKGKIMKITDNIIFKEEIIIPETAIAFLTLCRFIPVIPSTILVTASIATKQ